MASHSPLCCPREHASKLVDDAPRGIRRFLGAVFVATWVPWWFLVFSGADPTSDLRALILLVLGGSAPTYVALVLFRLEEGRSAFRNLRARMGHPPDRRWYAALALPVAVTCLAVLLTVSTGRAAWAALPTEHLFLLPVALLSGVLVGGLEPGDYFMEHPGRFALSFVGAVSTAAYAAAAARRATPGQARRWWGLSALTAVQATGIAATRRRARSSSRG